LRPGKPPSRDVEGVLHDHEGVFVHLKPVTIFSAKPQYCPSVGGPVVAGMGSIALLTSENKVKIHIQAAF
jgi:hypothetical protein